MRSGLVKFQAFGLPRFLARGLTGDGKNYNSPESIMTELNEVILTETPSEMMETEG